MFVTLARQILQPLSVSIFQNMNGLLEASTPSIANVLHIVNTTLGATLIQGSAAVLERGGFVLLYGPFKYRGKFTTESNANFDAFLRDRDSKSGIRDVEWVSAIAEEEGLKLIEDQDMPANNQFLIFRKLR